MDELYGILDVVHYSVIAKAPFTWYNLLSNRLSNRIDNWLYRVYKHSTSCQTRLTTGWFDNRLYRVNGV